MGGLASAPPAPGTAPVAQPQPMSQGAQRFQRQQKIESLFEGMDTYDAKIPEAIKPTFLAQMDTAADPKDARAKAANQALLSFVRPDLTPQIRDNWDAVRNQTAQKTFGATKPETTDTEFYGMLGKSIKDRNAFQVQATDMQHNIIQNSFEGDEDWKKAVPKAADPKVQAKLDELGAQTFATIKDQSHRLSPYVTKLSDLYSNFRVTNNQDVIPQMIDMIEHLPADQRQSVISLAAIKSAREMEGTTDNTIMSKVGENLDRGVAGLIQGARSGVAKLAAAQGPDPETRGMSQAQLEARSNRETTRTQLMEGYNAIADPQAAQSLMGKVALGLSSALPSMAAVAASPWIGLPLVFGETHNARSTALQAEGVPEGKANAMAAPQALVDTMAMAVSSKVLFGTGVAAIESTAARTGGQVLARGAKIAAYDLTTLAGVTAAQQLMPAAMQDWGHMLDEQVPGIQWADKPDGTKGMLHSLKDALPETAASVVSLMLLGAGKGTLAEYGKFTTSLRDTRSLVAAGWSAEQANRIADEVDPIKQLKLMHKLVPEGVGSKEQATATKQLDADAKEKLAGDVAKVEKNATGQYVVTNPLGDVIGTATTEESAGQIKANYDQAQTPVAKGLSALAKAVGGVEEEKGTETPTERQKPTTGQEPAAATSPETPLGSEPSREGGPKLTSKVETHDGTQYVTYYDAEGKEVGIGSVNGEAISHVQVHEQFRRQGYGTEILADLVSRGGNKGLAGSEGGKALMEKAGFKNVPETNQFNLKSEEPAPGIIQGSKADQWADQKIAELGKQASMAAFLDPTLLAAYAVKGAAYLEAGIRDFAAWSEEMRGHFGAQIVPHLKEIFDHAQANRAAIVADAAAEKVQTPLAKATEGARNVLRDIRNIKEFSPFRRILNKYIAEGQLTSLRVHREVERIMGEVPEYSKRVAITNWLQADGNPALLKERAAASTEGYRKGYEDAMKLSPKEIEVAQSIQQFYKDMLVQLQKNGVLEHGVQRYVNQMWQDTADGGKEGVDTPPPTTEQGKRLMMDTQHAKEKVFGSYFEGEQAGRVPVTKDIAHLVALYTSEVGKVIASRRLLKELSAAKAADGRPLAAVQGSLRESGLNEGVILGEPPKVEDPALIKANAKPEGYGTIDNPSFQGWKFLGKKADGQQVMMLGQMAVHPDIYQHLRNVFGESAIKTGLRPKPGDAMLTLGAKAFARGVLRTQEIMKGTTLGFLSPFHQVQEGTHAIGHHVNPFWGSPENLLDPENPLTRHAVEHGLMIAGDGAAMRLFKDSIDANLLHIMSDKLGGEKLGGFNPVNWSKSYSEYLFHSYIPRMKMKTFLSVESNNLDRYAKELSAGTVTKSDVAYLSAKQVNNAYGHMNWADIGISPTFQHMLRITLLAPDFLAARAAFTGEAIKGAAGAKSGREQIMAFTTLAITQYMTARLLNKVTDDDYHFDHPFSVVHDGREYTMRSVPEDIYKMVHAPEQFLRGRISPLSSIGFEALFQRNYRGEKVTYTDQVKDMASMFIPLTLRANPVYRSLLDNGGGQSVSPWQQLMGSMGIHISRNSPIAESYKLAGDFKKALSDEDKQKYNVAEDKGVYPTSQYQQLRYALEDGDTAKAASEYEKLKEAHGAKIVDGFHASLFHPFTGSQRLDAVMLEKATPEQRAMVELARHSRQQIWQSFNTLRQQAAAK